VFTGRISEVGEIEAVAGERVMVRAPKTAGRLRAGGSLNVAGVCVRHGTRPHVPVDLAAGTGTGVSATAALRWGLPLVDVGDLRTWL
jgi:riboflavin synthase alpha subunit